MNGEDGQGNIGSKSSQSIFSETVVKGIAKASLKLRLWSHLRRHLYLVVNARGYIQRSWSLAKFLSWDRIPEFISLKAFWTLGLSIFRKYYLLNKLTRALHKTKQNFPSFGNLRCTVCHPSLCEHLHQQFDIMNHIEPGTGEKKKKGYLDSICWNSLAIVLCRYSESENPPSWTSSLIFCIVSL